MDLDCQMCRLPAKASPPGLPVRPASWGQRPTAGQIAQQFQEFQNSFFFIPGRASNPKINK